MSRPRDFQRARVYRAERGIADERFASATEVHAYAQQILSSPWWRSRFSRPVNVVVRHTGRRGWARHGSARVSFPPFGWHKRYVLHELAHLVAGPEARHGEGYVKVLHAMFAEFLGEEYARRYRYQCAREGVFGCPSGAWTRDPVEFPVAAGPRDTPAPQNSLDAYERCYRKYRQGARSSAPSLRRGMTKEEAQTIRYRVDQEFA